MERWFSLSQAPLRVIGRDEAQLAPLLPLLGDLAQAPAATAAYTLVLETAASLGVPESAQLVFEGLVVAGGTLACRLYLAGPREILVVEGQTAIDTDPTQRTTTIRALPDCAPGVAATVAIVAIDAALAASGQYLLHGAGLQLRQDGRAILMFGQSGAGKTTAALALALSGYRLMSDDVLVLKPAAPGRTACAVWSLPRPLKVHRLTAELLPALEPIMHNAWDEAGEQVMTRAVLADVGAVAQFEDRAIAAVLVMGSRTDGPHQIVRVSKAEALLHLAQDNIGISKLGVPARNVARMEAIAAMLAQTPAFTLRVGVPLSGLGPAIEAHLSATGPGQSR